MPVLKIFPNNKELEFESDDDLRTWLLTTLKARNGDYRLRNADPIHDLPAGSIVLFRFGIDQIVGEAVVKSTEPHNEPDAEFPASVHFAPSSIRLFVPSISIATLQKIIGGPEVKDIGRANPYAKFDNWSIYPKLLAAHLKNGGHFL